MSKWVLLLALVPALHAIPILENPQRPLHVNNTLKPSFKPRDDVFSPLNLIGQFCQGTGQPEQCGANNCESWSTGLRAGGANAGRIYCNDQGIFCYTDGKCYPIPCMDKSADTQVLNFTYLPETSHGPASNLTYVHYIDNSLDFEMNGTFLWHESVQSTYKWEWETDTQLSVLMQSTVQLPDDCNIFDDVTTNVSTNAGSLQTVYTTKVWNSDQPYSVGAQKTVKLTFTVSRMQLVVPFQQNVQFGANLAFWCSTETGGHHFWMEDASAIVGMSPLCSGNVCTFNGVFTALVGVTTSYTSQDCDLNERC